jgi:hypothetical protein
MVSAGDIALEFSPQNIEELKTTRIHGSHNRNEVCVLNIIDAVRIVFQFVFYVNQPRLGLCKREGIVSSTYNPNLGQN